MPRILYFSTPTCGPCKMFKPIVQQVSKETGVNIAYIDATLDPTTAQQFNVSVVPTIIIENGGNVLYRNSGVMSKPQLIQVLSQFK
jgi:thioredoxin 1